MTNLDGSVAIVTGGGSGIGLATVVRFGELGATVVAADVDERTRAAAEAAGAEFHSLDVRDADAWGRFVGGVLERHGRIDIAHLNAGVMSPPRGSEIGTDPLAWLTGETYERVVGVNLGGVYFGILAVLPHFRQRGRGEIVVTASAAGVEPLAIDPLYSTSKHGVVGLVRSLAPTLAKHGIRIQAICPGGVDTSLPPPDLLKPDRKFSDPSFQADAVINALDAGEAGDIWLTFDPDQEFQKYTPSPLWRAQSESSNG